MIEKLEQILKERIKHGYISRWSKVSVTTWADSHNWVKDVYPESDSNIYIVWNGSKSKTNHHDYEIKEFPISELPELIRRNKQRLENKSKLHK